MFNDLLSLWFSPTTFFKTRFLELDSFRIRLMGLIGVVLGLALGSLCTFALATYVLKEFSLRPEDYVAAIKNLSLDTKSFLEMLSIQKAYALLLALLSGVIAYMAPHIFGGAVFAFLWLLIRDTKTKLDFGRIMDCASIALSGMIFYAIPAVGPIIALFVVGINLSRALFIKEHISGFMKTMGIIMALYICFFVSAASLQLVAVPLASKLNF